MPWSNKSAALVGQLTFLPWPHHYINSGEMNQMMGEGCSHSSDNLLTVHHEDTELIRNPPGTNINLGLASFNENIRYRNLSRLVLRLPRLATALRIHA